MANHPFGVVEPSVTYVSMSMLVCVCVSGYYLYVNRSHTPVCVVSNIYHLGCLNSTIIFNII